MKTVKIQVREIGQKFAHDAVVRDSQGHKLHETREFPYGMGHNAYAVAKAWAEKQGYQVAALDGDAS